jgi:aryl-alcohol dehydrogenase-like predicted oxidoreductase
MIDLAPFGQTGHLSSRVIFGAAALGRMSPARAEATLQLVRAAGINHIDTAASYGDAEIRLASFLDQHRTEVFLATKTGERTADGARRELESSLERMGVDHVDLIQLHNLVEDDEWKVVHGRGGALEALVAARDEGLVRHIGVTGHGLRIASMHRRSLEAFPYAAVLLPFNHSLMTRPAYRADVDDLLAVCADRAVAVQTIKAVARGRWSPRHDGPRYSWYEPLPEGPALDRAVAFVLAHPQLFLNSTSDARLLPAVIAAASVPSTLPDDAVLADDEREFGISALFDGAALERI